MSITGRWEIEVCRSCGWQVDEQDDPACGCDGEPGRWVSVEVVPAEQLAAAVGALHEAVKLARDFNRGAMTWQEYDRKLAALETAHPRGR